MLPLNPKSLTLERHMKTNKSVAIQLSDLLHVCIFGTDVLGTDYIKEAWGKQRLRLLVSNIDQVPKNFTSHNAAQWHISYSYYVELTP